MANSMDPDQAVFSGSTLFGSILNSSVMLGNYLQQTTLMIAQTIGLFENDEDPFYLLKTSNDIKSLFVDCSLVLSV